MAHPLKMKWAEELKERLKKNTLKEVGMSEADARCIIKAIETDKEKKK